MKQAIRLSSLRTPLIRVRGHHTVDYLDGFWLRLYWEWAARFMSWWHRPKLITVRLRFLLAIIPLLQLYPHSGHVIYADPISPAIISLKPLEPIPMPSVSPQEPLQAVFVSKLRPYGTYPNTYAPFNCTSYVASRLPVPNSWGNASSWSYRAALDGYKVSPVPDVGTIATNTTDSYLGHVAIVAEVSGGMVRLEEQNYAGPGVITSDRWAPISSYVYIYV